MDELHRTEPDRSRGGEGVLWATAFVLGALVILQAGRPIGTGGGPVPASAAAAAASGARFDGADGFSIIASRTGRGDDADPNEIVWVIDSRAEAMMVYQVEDARRGGVIFREGANLRGLFQAARR